jgi:hypothetical protein
MLNVFDESNPLSRRKLLGIGSLGLGGLSLASLLGAKLGAVGSAGKRNPLTGKSVIFLFQQGGPSQFETFDPKPDAPEGIRTVTDVIPTSIPGIHFGSAMEQLSKLAHKLVTVRSFRTNNSGHNIRPIVGPESLGANIGVHFARVAGTTRPSTGIPTNAILYPASVTPGVPGPSARGNLAATGPHPPSFAPFVPGGKGNLQEDMKLILPREPFLNGRKSLLVKLDQLKRRADEEADFKVVDDLHAQAYEVLLGGECPKLSTFRKRIHGLLPLTTHHISTEVNDGTKSLVDDPVTTTPKPVPSASCFSWPAGCVWLVADSLLSMPVMPEFGICTLMEIT